VREGEVRESRGGERRRKGGFPVRGGEMRLREDVSRRDAYVGAGRGCSGGGVNVEPGGSRGVPLKG